MASEGDTTSDRLLIKKTDYSPPKPEKRTGFCAPCQWFKEAPLTRWEFALFLSFSVLAIVWCLVRVTGQLAADVLAGLCGIVLAIHGSHHFRILLGLKEEVTRLGVNNKDFRLQNSQLRTEVHKLSQAQEQLSAVEARLKETTKQHAENIEKFKQLDKKLQGISGDNIEAITNLQKMSGFVRSSLEDELIQHERSILMKVMEHMEFRNEEEGLNHEEWDRLISALPLSFQRRFSAMDESFDDIAGDSGIICIDKFKELADRFAEEEAHRLLPEERVAEQ
eukprot:45025_1